jgi:hypothetical protein
MVALAACTVHTVDCRNVALAAVRVQVEREQWCCHVSSVTSTSLLHREPVVPALYNCHTVCF